MFLLCEWFWWWWVFFPSHHFAHHLLTCHLTPIYFCLFNFQGVFFLVLKIGKTKEKLSTKKKSIFEVAKINFFIQRVFFGACELARPKNGLLKKLIFFHFFLWRSSFLFCEIARPKKGLFENWTCKEWLFLVLLLFKKESIFRCCEFTNPKNGFLFFGYLALVIVFLSIALFIIIDKQCEIMKNNELFIYLLFITLFIVVLIIF